MRINLRAPKKDNISTLEKMLIDRELNNLMAIANFGSENELMLGSPFVKEAKYLQHIKLDTAWNFAPP